MPDDFFEDSTVQEVAQAHIEQVLALEESESEKLIKQYRKIRNALRDRLDRLPSGSFSAQQLRGTLVQIESAIEAMDDSLIGAMKKSSEKLFGTGIDHLIEEFKKYEKHFNGAVTPISIDRVLLASDAKEFLFNKYDTSIRAYSADVRATLAGGLSQAAIEGVGTGEVVKRLGTYFNDEQWKLERIARTELHFVYNYSKQSGLFSLQENYFQDLKKTLIHPMDKRTGDDSKFVARKNLIVPVDEPFTYTWQGQKRSYMTPPDRPNDRSIMVPYRDSWES